MTHSFVATHQLRNAVLNIKPSSDKEENNNNKELTCLLTSQLTPQLSTSQSIRLALITLFSRGRRRFLRTAGAPLASGREALLSNSVGRAQRWLHLAVGEEGTARRGKRPRGGQLRSAAGVSSNGLRGQRTSRGTQQKGTQQNKEAGFYFLVGS